MSLYTRHKDTATDVGHTHSRLMVAYFQRRSVLVEHNTLAALRSLEYQVTNLVTDELDKLRKPWTVFTSDTDCDGTSYQAHRVENALDEDDAIQRFVAQTSWCYDIGGAIPEDDFITTMGHGFDTLDSWSQNYYIDEGYVTLGNTWS